MAQKTADLAREVIIPGGFVNALPGLRRDPRGLSQAQLIIELR